MVNRPAFTKIATELYRDFNTIGDPGSGIFDPIKSDLRTYQAAIESFLNDLYDKAPSLLTNIGGSANAVTADATPAVDALAAGQVYLITPTSTNTAAAPTLAINSLTAKVLADADGVDLPIGGWVANRQHSLSYDGTKLRVVAIRDLTLYKMLDADDTGGQNVNTAQPWFPTTGTITLPVGSWFVDAFLWLSRSAGANAHTTNILFAGSATYTIDWNALINAGDVATIAAPTFAAAAVATSTNIKASSSSTTEQILIRLRARLAVTVTGTFIPQFIYSAAPGGAPTVKRGSFIMLTPRPAGLTQVGAWS